MTSHPQPYPAGEASKTGHGGLARRYTPVAQREIERAELEDAIAKHPLAWILMTAKSAEKDSPRVDYLVAKLGRPHR
ncbi:MAG: hypothetical protein JRM77_04840 [Nitrososphaerota archaeon]|nr:hypothetical protein [Nitrososphaerota archaeon]